MPTPDAMLANLLGEVKLAEKKLADLTVKRTAVENSIRAALRSGDRPAAEKLALALERVKDEQKQRENQRAQARAAYERGKVSIKNLKTNLKTAQATKHTSDALGKILDANSKLTDADDILRSIELEVATTEARLEIAADHADTVIEPQIDPKLLAESVLAEFEDAPPPAARVTPPPTKSVGPAPGDTADEPPPGTGKSIG